MPPDFVWGPIDSAVMVAVIATSMGPHLELEHGRGNGGHVDNLDEVLVPQAHALCQLKPLCAGCHEAAHDHVDHQLHVGSIAHLHRRNIGRSTSSEQVSTLTPYILGAKRL